MRPALLLSFILLFAPVFLLGQNSDAIMQYAAELMAAGEYELAIQQFELADDVDHGNAHAKIGMAEAYYFLGDYEEVLDLLEYMGPRGRYPKSDYIKALVLFKKKDFDDARILFLSCLENEVVDNELPYYIAVCDYHLGNISEAIQGFEAYHLVNDSMAYSHYYLGQSYLEADSLQVALRAALRATVLDEKTPRMWRGLGDVEFASEKYDAAVMHYGKALLLNPNYREARLRRGIAHYENGTYALAKSDLEQTTSDGSRDELALRTLLDCYYSLNEYEAFLKTVDVLFSIDPGAADLLFKRGYMHFVHQQLESAIDDFEILADLYPEDTGIHHQLGNCYAEKKDYPSAIYHYELASKDGTGLDDSRYNLAVVYHKSGRAADACLMWKYLIENANDPDIKANSEEYNDLYCR